MDEKAAEPLLVLKEEEKVSLSLTKKQKTINLLKTSLVPLALLNIFLLPFDLRVLDAFLHLTEPVDTWIAVLTIGCVCFYSLPFGRHIKKRHSFLAVLPFLIIIALALWYDLLLIDPIEPQEGTVDVYPWWTPQRYVNPGSLRASFILTGFLLTTSNCFPLILLLSGKSAFSKQDSWVTRTRTRRVVFQTFFSFNMVYLKYMVLTDAVTFDDPTRYDIDGPSWLDVLLRSWSRYGSPFTAHGSGALAFNWSKLILANAFIAFYLNMFLFRKRGGGFFFTFDRLTWRCIVTCEPGTQQELKNEPFAARHIRQKPTLAEEPKNVLQDEEKPASTQEPTGHQSDFVSNSTFGPVNVVLFGLWAVFIAHVIFCIPLLFA